MSTKPLSSIESLLSSAFTRTKERFLSFFLASLMMYLLIAAVAIVGVLLFLVITGVTTALGGGIISFILRALSLLLFPLGILFVSAWSTLAATTTVVNPVKIGVLEAYKSTKPFVPQFMVVQILILFFIIGLIPLGIITLGIPLLLWYVWGSMMAFVFIEKKKKGLENLWISKEAVSSNFWGVCGRMVLIFIAIFFFSILIMSSKSGALIVIWQLINALFIGPFWVSYAFEIYSQLEKKETAPMPIVWVIESIVGLVLIVIVTGTGVKKGLEVLPTIMQQQINKQQLNKQQYQQQYQQQLNDQIYKNSGTQPAKIQFGQ